MIKKVFFINIFLVIFLVLLLELIFNIFKLSGLMGIERGLIYKKGDTFFLNTNKKEKFLMKSFLLIILDLGRLRKIFNIIVKKIYSY